ncbi:MAG: hypothetical protein JST16_03095 [Bdellovibrionales bacterium]|nr:hypothetical protein [Bdellovibrionales bacterium]
MEKLHEANRTSLSVSRRGAAELQELQKSLEAELHDSVNLGEIFDAVIDAYRKNPQRLSISRKWTCERAFSHMKKTQTDICTGLLDGEKAKAIYKFLQTKAEQTERALKNQGEEVLCNAEGVVHKPSRKRAGKSEGLPPQDTPQIRESASQNESRSKTA